MSTNDITIFIFIVATIQAIMGAFVFFASKSRSSRVFVLTLAFNTLWMTAIALFISAADAGLANLFVRVAYFAGILIGEGFFFFFLLYPDSTKRELGVKSIFTAVTLAFAYILFKTNLVITDAFSVGGISQWGWHFGPLWYSFSIVFYPMFFLGFALLLYKGLHAEGLIRKNALLMFWGVLILISTPTLVNVVMPQFGMFQFIWLGPLLAITWVTVIAYAIIKYEALDIKVIAKRALAYALIVVVVGLVIVTINFLNNSLIETYHNFSPWILYLVSAMITAGIGYFVWLKVRENDVLKYEFITIITHKLRTPLTQIKWSNEEIKERTSDPLIKEPTDRIDTANKHILTLLDSLVTLSDSEGSYLYTPHDIVVTPLVDEALISLKNDFAQRKITLTVDLNSTGTIKADSQKISFIIQTLLHNALIYTPVGGRVSVSLSENKKKIQFIVSDSGIGISKKDLSLMFTKFHRAKNAKNVDTEGSGIGLFISRIIAERSGGSITVASAGENMGTTFRLELPMVH
jgi:signal transduction histidine kinase